MAEKNQVTKRYYSTDVIYITLLNTHTHTHQQYEVYAVGCTVYTYGVKV